MFSSRIGYRCTHRLDHQVFHAGHLSNVLSDLFTSQRDSRRGNWGLLQSREAQGIDQGTSVEKI